eukprot:XP_790543.3 PREDICTED: RNA polymerase II degradation factor 1 isoform X3 [Strongylocentrotus purpuratus]
MMEEHVRAIRSMWQDCLATNQRAASKAQNEFQKQVNAIQNGATLDSMKAVEVPAPYKPEGLVKGASSGSPTPQPALTLPSSMNHETGMAAPGSWTMSATRMQPVDHQDGMIAAPTAEGVPQNGGAVENQSASQPLTAPEAQRKVMAMAQAEAMAEAQAQAQAQEQVQATQAHAQAQAQAKAKAQQIQQAQAMSRAQNSPVVSQGEATIQQAAMSGNGFNHHQQSNAIPPNMQHAQHQMQMSQQQGAAARHQHQLQQQQMLARQQYMEQQVARPKNSFERIMLRLHGFFPNYNKVQLTGFLKEVRTSNNGSLSGQSVEEIIRRVKDLVRQRQRETAGNASQRMQNKGFTNHQGMSGGRPTAPPATFNAQPKRSSSYHNAPTPPQPAWSTVGHIQGLNWHKELVDGEVEEEDPCVICHDEMSGDNTVEIECGHIFHIHCLHEWLKQQQTCPTCSNFIILEDDNPSLHK